MSQDETWLEWAQREGVVPLPHAYRWRDDRVAHRATCTAAEMQRGSEVRVFRYDYQLEFWLYAGKMELCPKCNPGEFP